jgi:SAM-dependent methyltransferase
LEPADPEFKFILDFVKKWKPTRVLELGCNVGREIKMLEGLVPELYGVDHDAAKIEKAKSYVPSATFDVAEAGQLPYSDDFFDCVFSSGGILSKNVPEKVLPIINEALRVSRGRFVICEYLGTRMTPDPNVYQNCKANTWVHDYDTMLAGLPHDTQLSTEVVVGFDKFRVMVIVKGLLPLHRIEHLEPKVNLILAQNEKMLFILERLTAPKPKTSKWRKFREWVGDLI